MPSRQMGNYNLVTRTDSSGDCNLYLTIYIVKSIVIAVAIVKSAEQWLPTITD